MNPSRYFAYRMFWTSALLLLFTVSTGCRQPGETQEPTMQQVSDPIARGRASYESFCMSCHGPEAKGNGPVATLLKVPPPDLTQISRKHNGSFPATMIYEQIDGREDIRAHGTREMPVWGNIWSEKDGVPQSEDDTRRQISELVEYLRSIQDSTFAM